MAEGFVSDPVRLPNGNLVVPQTMTGEDGLTGDRFVEITPDHPEYEAWLPFVEQTPS